MTFLLHVWKSAGPPPAAETDSPWKSEYPRIHVSAEGPQVSALKFHTGRASAGKFEAGETPRMGQPFLPPGGYRPRGWGRRTCPRQPENQAGEVGRISAEAVRAGHHSLGDSAALHSGVLHSEERERQYIRAARSLGVALLTG